jgi:hypothetical protein
MKCPIISANHELLGNCNESECAWYNVTHKMCSVLAISKALSGIEYLKQMEYIHKGGK